MRETGAPQDLIDEKLEELLDKQEAVYEVLPCNYDAVRLYVACYGHFDWIEGAEKRIMVGFKRDAVDIEIRLSKIKVTAKTWERFKTLEALTVQFYRH